MVSLIAGIMVMLSGYFRLGRIVERVPRSIVVGFTIGNAIVIAFSQIGEVLGSREKVGYGIVDQLSFLFSNIHLANIYALLIALITFIFCKIFLKVSSFIPGPLIALAFGFLAGQTFWADKGLILIADKYGSIPTDFLVITPPLLPEVWTSKIV